MREDTRVNGYICVYDPGVATGYCKLLVDPHAEHVITIVETAELTLHDMYHRFVSGQAIHEADVIVFESFIINAGTAKKTPQPWSLELIGLARAHLAVAGRKLVLQKPGDAKTFADNKKLKEYGFWHVGGEGHARDALRHALLWLAGAGYMKNVLKGVHDGRPKKSSQSVAKEKRT